MSREDVPYAESGPPKSFVEVCDKFDWTPEEALRFYAEGKHFDVVDGRTRILCTGAIASHALKGLGEDYAAMKGVERNDPVAWRHTMHYEEDCGSHSVFTGSPEHPFGKPDIDYDKIFRVTSTPLYA